MESKEMLIGEPLNALRLEVHGDIVNDLSNRVYKAMDEYAQQMAIEFAEWVDSWGYKQIYKGLFDYNGEHKTATELYKIFINEKKKENGL